MAGEFEGHRDEPRQHGCRIEASSAQAKAERHRSTPAGSIVVQPIARTQPGATSTARPSDADR